jgi:cellulose synthase/poly-beta-1,6-N-acetylglucosamine synthase-like glycosyltransferase
MLETISLLVSLFLLTYSIRSLVFLYWSDKYYRLLDKISFPNTYQKTHNIIDGQGRWVTFNDNVPLLEKLEMKETVSMTFLPMVSILIATKNEESVIGDLLDSIDKLTYDKKRYEVVIVDDSTDSTFQILEKRKKRIANLKIVKRTRSVGWKGGALNLALKFMRIDSQYVIVVDADVILPCDIIQQFVSVVQRNTEDCNVVQGYCIPNNSTWSSHSTASNWVSKGVEFRLAQRNMIEFFAKDKLNLPLQITGSLFMIKSPILREIGFSNDLCEDWDLTLQLYLRGYGLTTAQNNDTNILKSHILFHEKLNATNQAPNSFVSYFKQRLRVSEGHTRGFIKMIPCLVKSIQPLKSKLEITLTGFQYLKNIFSFSLLMINLCALIIADFRIFNPVWLTSIIIQSFCISVFLFNVTGFVLCAKKTRYNSTHVLSKLFLDFCTLPAFVTGSTLGIIRKKGSFYETRRISKYS